MSQQAAAHAVGERHAPEPAAVDVRDSIVLGQPLVDERIIGPHEVQDAAILADLAGHEQLRLARERLAQVVVPLRKQLGGRYHAGQRAQGQPLQGEAVDEGLGAGIGQHAPHLPPQHVRVTQLTARRDVQQLVVREAAPEEERQPRRQLQVTDRVYRAGPRIHRVALDAEQELRIDEDALQGPLDPGVESARVPPRREEPLQRGQIDLGHWPAEGPPRDGSENLPRARLLRPERGAAHEQPLPTGRIAGSGGIERTGDAHLIDRRLGRFRRRAPALGDSQHLPGRPRLQHAVAFGPALDEGNAEHARPRLRRDADREALVGVERVLLPGPVPEHGARERSWRRRPGGAADMEQRHPLAVQAHLELLPVLQAAHVVVELPLQPDANVVLPVQREIVAYRDAAAGPERQVLAHPQVLEPHRGNDVGLGRRLDRRISDRQAADPARREDVAVEQRRGHRQNVRHVVEAEIGVVGGQQRARIDVQREQIAHRVLVLAPVQTVDRGATRIGTRGRGPVQGVLQRRGNGFVRGRVRPPPAGRRHRTGPQLEHDLLPRIRMVAHPSGVHLVQGESRRPQPFVVAADAVAVQNRADGLSRRRLVGSG